MQLYSLLFVLYMLSLLACYYAVARIFKRFQWIVILVFSCIFYALVTNIETISYGLFTLCVTYASSHICAYIARYFSKRAKAIPDRTKRKRFKAHAKHAQAFVLCLCVILIIINLCYLKYWNTILFAFGAASSTRSLGLLLPLGISFYTFQALAYVFDVYNQKYAPERNILKLACFLFYFPQLIQGPINRFDKLSPALFSLHEAKDTHFAKASLTFAYGMLKKYVMADLLVDSIAKIFNQDPTTLPGSVLVFGILLYSAQQYGDFSGGIDMLEAASEMLGIRMQPNFRRPYFSISLADFWRRWHISLGLWMKDYVFYPLALSRPFKYASKHIKKLLGDTSFATHMSRTVPAGLANIFVFLLVGIWHGADMHFISWGLYNGIVIALSDMFRPLTQALATFLHIKQEGKGYHIFSILRTFIVVNIGWYFDRIESFDHAISALVTSVCSFRADAFMQGLALAGVIGTYIAAFQLAVIAAIIVCGISIVQEYGIEVRTWICARPFALRAAIYIIVGFLLLLASNIGTSHGGFMYANY